jgi:hypothetical protein
MSDPHTRANVLRVRGGKAIGLTLLLTAMGIYLSGGVHAQTPPRRSRRRKSTPSTPRGR